ncbi:MAG: hypothetical protein AAGH46_13875 [Bacteroidota bacterium]
MKNFKRQIVEQNESSKNNLIASFDNAIRAISEYHYEMNAKLGSFYSLAEVIGFISQPDKLKARFDEINLSAAVEKANSVGIKVSDLDGLDSIPLTKIQSSVLEKLQGFKNSTPFLYGLSPKDWMDNDANISITKEVEDAFTEATTTYTVNEKTNSRLKVLEAVEQHFQQFPNDKPVLKRILFYGRNPNRAYINFGER